MEEKNRVNLNIREFQTINEIVQENQLSEFTIVQDTSSGIGNLTNIEFESKINGRYSIVSIPITTVEHW